MVLIIGFRIQSSVAVGSNSRYIGFVNSDRKNEKYKKFNIIR